MEGDGKAAAVRGGAGPGLGGLRHDRSQGLVNREHGPHFMLDAEGAARTQHPALPEGVPQRVICGLVLPPLVVEGDQGRGPEAAGVGRGGGEAVGAGERGAVLAGHGDFRFDDADRDGAENGQVGAVAEAGAEPGYDSWRGVGPGTGRRCRPLGQEGAGVEAES